MHRHATHVQQGQVSHALDPQGKSAAAVGSRKVSGLVTRHHAVPDRAGATPQSGLGRAIQQRTEQVAKIIWENTTMAASGLC
jgi:hypothetical protein